MARPGTVFAKPIAMHRDDGLKGTRLRNQKARLDGRTEERTW
jgi:hypothetical protein